MMEASSIEIFNFILSRCRIDLRVNLEWMIDVFVKVENSLEE